MTGERQLGESEDLVCTGSVAQIVVQEKIVQLVGTDDGLSFLTNASCSVGC